MSAKETEIDAVIGRVIRRSQAVENLLRLHYQATSRSLHKAIDELGDALPAVLIRTIRVIARARNAAAHPDRFHPNKIPPDFDRLCSEMEVLIPYFASQQKVKPAQPPKKAKSPAPKPQSTASVSKPQINGLSADSPANRGKPWTPEEDRELTDAFDAQISIMELAKALQRGVGGIQNRLIKLGKLPAEQYATYPPDGHMTATPG